MPFDSHNTGQAASPARILSGMSFLHPAARTFWPVRIWRLFRLLCHLLSGMLEIRRHFAHASPQERQQRIQRWSREMLQVMGIRLRIKGTPPLSPPPNTLWVCNHISWLDIFIINAMVPCRFVAKADVEGWPLVGWLCKHAGTLFIKRGDRRDMMRMNEDMTRLLQDGETLGFFPEGTTSDGTSVLPFTASLLNAVTLSEGDLRPVALRYRTEDDQPSAAATYIGETSLLQSMWQLASAKVLVAELTLLPSMNAAHVNRRELASQAHQQIRDVIERDPAT